MHITVGFATHGRSAVLAGVVAALAEQTRRPDRVIVCATGAADIQGLPTSVSGHVGAIPVEVLFSAAGLPKQRNAILDAAAASDLLVFLDDDFLMGPGYLATLEEVMARRPELAGATGDLYHDEVKGPGLSLAEARQIIDAAVDVPARGDEVELVPHLYGCNMALRQEVVQRAALRFDERLPLYAWSEDVDFAHRLRRHGVLGKLRGARGVHLGVKSGRTSGYRLGYSQVANPIYLFGKGSYSAGRAGRSVLRNLMANAARAAWPEPWIDRRGRLRGNIRALVELCAGRLAPERVLDL